MEGRPRLLSCRSGWQQLLQAWHPALGVYASGLASVAVLGSLFSVSMERAGYVGLFNEPFGHPQVEAIVQSWIDRFGSVEQTAGTGAQILTLPVRAVADLVWQKDLQFRILSGHQFAWVYVTMERRVVETSGLAPPGGDALCHDVLVDAPGCREIINERNDERLEQLEKLGLM